MQFQCKIPLAVWKCSHFNPIILLFLADGLLICQRHCGIILSEMVYNKVLSYCTVLLLSITSLYMRVCSFFFQSYYQMSLVTIFCRATWPISSYKFTKNRSVGLYSVDAFAISPGAAIGAELVNFWLWLWNKWTELSWKLTVFNMRSVSCSVWLAGAFLLLACAGCYCKAHVEPFDGSWINSPCVDSSNTHQTSLIHVPVG